MIVCPNCDYDGSPPEDEFRSGGGWHISHSITQGAAGAIQVEEWNCPICGTVAHRDEERAKAWDPGR